MQSVYAKTGTVLWCGWNGKIWKTVAGRHNWKVVGPKAVMTEMKTLKAMKIMKVAKIMKTKIEHNAMKIMEVAV